MGRQPGDVRATVEVAHEALIQRWPTLQAWVDSNREKLRARAAILRAMDEWEENRRDDSFLLNPGVQLERGRALLGDPGDVPVDDIRDYISRSIQKRRKRQRRILGVTSVSLIALFAFLSRSLLLTKYYQENQGVLINTYVASLHQVADRAASQSSDKNRVEVRRIFLDLEALRKYGDAPVDLSKIKLADLDFSDISLTNIRFIGTVLDGINFSAHKESADPAYSRFDDSVISRSSFVGADLSFAQLFKYTLGKDVVQ